ncbi:unnamed protein product [Paramecium octaurelia]|uniref:Uncharacterized protein n=1 Tax=Paramecium octaurelia TaxID=43137 RepID=A0A8S1VCV8_PAROT|nr:unnamed protein product [Paramecium octaurelia]
MMTEGEKVNVKIYKIVLQSLYCLMRIQQKQRGQSVNAYMRWKEDLIGLIWTIEDIIKMIFLLFQ